MQKLKTEFNFDEIRELSTGREKIKAILLSIAPKNSDLLSMMTQKELAMEFELSQKDAKILKSLLKEHLAGNE